ncbi:MAG: trypsin-like peptidase domain-containing protein [Frankiaceae bacterium]
MNKVARSPRACIVRLRDSSGAVVGAGWLADESHVVTCAHVVAQALGIPPGTADAPAGTLTLDFPLVQPARQLQATVQAWSGIDEAGDRPSDVAVLKIVDELPSGASAPSLHDVREYWGRKFRAFGFPLGYDDGQWASGLLIDEQAAGWVQIEDVKSTGYFVVPGFSGTPVWDLAAGGVVGMVVGADARPEVRAAFMIPVRLLARAWPTLQAATEAEPARQPDTGEVVALIDTPMVPDFAQMPAERFDELFTDWLLFVVDQFFHKVQIIIDKGSADGVSAGDYFALIGQHDLIANAQGDVIGSVIKEGSLIRAVDVQEGISVCQLTDWLYKLYFDHIGEVAESLADSEGNLDLEQLSASAALYWPVQKGASVMRISPAEKVGRDEVAELYGRTLDDTVADDERRFLHAEMVRKANAFLLEHATGYFASAVLYQRGYAQLKLGQYRDAIDTFELFLRRYPFSPSADGARELSEEARDALKRGEAP